MTAPVYEPEPDFLETAFGLDGVPDNARLTVADALRAAYTAGAVACQREVIQSLRGQARSAGGDHHQAALAYAASSFEDRQFPAWIRQRPPAREPETQRTTGEETGDAIDAIERGDHEAKQGGK